MPLALTTDDFKLYRAVCEVRYDSAYLLFDRSGQLLYDLRAHLKNLNVNTATPNQILFTADNDSFGIEINKCSVTNDRPDSKLQTFSKTCDIFIDTVSGYLKVNVFTRIGLRLFFRKEYKKLEEAKAALVALNLPNLGTEKRFNISSEPSEVFFRWEDEQVGSSLRLRPEKSTLEITTPSEFGDETKTTRTAIGLTLDVDYYTVAPVEEAQWDVSEWMPQRLRMIKKEIDGILMAGGNE